MGRKTKIDWCDSSWNPVTGCLHGCEYCYARRIAERFGGCDSVIEAPGSASKIHVLDQPAKVHGIAPYPFFFEPTLHRYQLEKPQHWKKPLTVFVCSMADLFGWWVPDSWLREVFDACKAAPQHRYLFLTKAPDRYAALKRAGITPPNESWIGTSVVCDEDARDGFTSKVARLSENWNMNANWFASVEPIRERLSTRSIEHLAALHWVIIGAETGNCAGKVIPQKEWIMDIADACALVGTPVFMKESIRGIVGSDFRQEFPWG